MLRELIDRLLPSPVEREMAKAIASMRATIDRQADLIGRFQAKRGEFPDHH